MKKAIILSRSSHKLETQGSLSEGGDPPTNQLQHHRVICPKIEHRFVIGQQSALPTSEPSGLHPPQLHTVFTHPVM